MSYAEDQVMDKKPSTQEGARLPNPTIQFQDVETRPAPLATRAWYHVPRVGEYVDLGADGHGQVDTVAWTDEKIIVVLRGSGRRE
jgi:hypothetical protein